MKHSIATIICCLLMSNTVLADSVEMADLMRSNGKIYVVVAVIAIIFIGLMAYLYRIDQRVKNSKNKMKNRDYFNSFSSRYYRSNSITYL